MIGINGIIFLQNILHILNVMSIKYYNSYNANIRINRH